MTRSGSEVCDGPTFNLQSADADLRRLDRESIVEEGNWHKFTHSENYAELKRQLLATGDKLLVEASPYDRIWGVGFKAADADANRAKWGLNLLGKALMRVRYRIRQMEAEEAAKVKANA